MLRLPDLIRLIVHFHAPTTDDVEVSSAAALIPRNLTAQGKEQVVAIIQRVCSAGKRHSSCVEFG